MEFPEKEIRLKDGRTAILRSPTGADAAAMLDFLRASCEETDFLLRTPEECDMTLEGERGFLEGILTAPDSVMINCMVDGALAGNCNLSRLTRKKVRHRASVAIAVRQQFWGLGIGTALFREMIDLARSWGVTMLELEVIEGNQRAIALYEKMGFTTVGTRPNAIRLPDGTMRKEYIMVREV